MARVAMSKKLRFDVFERDGFTCQYCGMQPPAVVLHVDHINPVSAGGTNAPENLVTSCQSCNGGKGKRVLKTIEANPTESLRRLQELAEIKLMAAQFRSADRARTRLRRQVCGIICDIIGQTSCQKASITTITNMMQEFGPKVVFGWLDYSTTRVAKGSPLPKEADLMRYMCGIAKNNRAEA